jgi:hypothetical protein
LILYAVFNPAIMFFIVFLIYLAGRVDSAPKQIRNIEEGTADSGLTSETQSCAQKNPIFRAVENFWQKSTKQAELEFFADPYFLYNRAGSITSYTGSAKPPSSTRAAALSDWWVVAVKTMEHEKSKRHCMRTALEILMFMYMGVTKKALRMVICVEGVPGSSLVLADPSIGCLSSSHIFPFLIAVLVLLGFTVGFPVVIILKSAVGDDEFKSWLQPARFDAWVRLKFIYNENNRWWMATVMGRRVVLVLVTIAVQLLGQDFTIFGQSMNTKSLSFFLFVALILMQTVRQPYELEADNIMEGCVLVALMAAVYFDINQGYHSSGSDGEVQLNTIMVGLLVLCIVGVWLLQGPGRTKLANLAKAGERRRALRLLAA